MSNFTKGSIKKRMIVFSIPIIFSLITQQLYQVADTIIVGKFLGVDELASVGNAGSIIGVFIVISGGIEMGCEVILARYMGKEQYQTIFLSAIGILLFAGCTALCLSAVSIAMEKPIFILMKIPPELWNLTSQYMTICSCGFISFYIYDISRAILISTGDAKTPFLIVVMTSFLNIILDLFFICGLNKGIAGAAMGTVFSQTIGMLVVLRIVIKRIKAMPHNKVKFIFPKAQLKEVLLLSCPLMIQQGILSLSVLLLQSLINPFGSEMISGYIAANKIIMLLMIVVIGLCQTLSIFTAQNLGANQSDRIQKGYRFSVQIVILYVIFVVILNFIFAKPMLSVFVHTKEYPSAVEFGAHYLTCNSIMLLFYGLKNMNESILRSYAKMRAFLISNVSDLLVRVGMTATLIPFFALDSFWIANTLGAYTAFIMSILLIRHYKIKTYR